MANGQMNLSEYGIQPVAGTFGIFHVWNGKGDRYTVNCRKYTCDCPNYIREHQRYGTCCKHLLNCRALVAHQIGVYYAEQRNLIAREKMGIVSMEQSRVQGQRLDDAIFALQSIADNLWGSGNLMVPAEYAAERMAA